MHIFIESPPIELNCDKVLDEKHAQIHLITQYFLPTHNDRRHEIDYCLQQNIHNPCIDRIHLLNEQIYSFDHFQTPDKIVQANIEKRLTFKHVFQYIRDSQIEGFIVLSNADIFFDSHLKKLKQTMLPFRKEILALLRWEFSSSTLTNLEDCSLYGPCPDSQDTWIFHTSMMKTLMLNIFK